MKIFFLGTPSIAIPSLEKLANRQDVEIIGVGVFPDKPVGRKKEMIPAPVKKRAIEINLPIYEIENKKKLVQVTNQLDFDLGIVIAFGMIFPAEILKNNFFVNVHFSLLPKWRGASPVQSAILNGQTETGITWQRMVYALDAGNILFQKQYDITDKNTLEVWSEFAKKTAESWDDFFAQLNKKQQETKKIWQGLPQAENNATFCGKFKKTDGLINPKTETNFEIYRKFLAFTPWPGIYMETKYGNLKIRDCVLRENEISNDSLNLKNYFELKCKKGNNLYIKRAQLAGKKNVDIKDLLNGYEDIFEL